jgi:hypothetical protein
LRCRHGAETGSAVLLDRDGEEHRVLFGEAEHRMREPDHEISGRVFVIMKDELDQPAIGSNAIHENPQTQPLLE